MALEFVALNAKMYSYRNPERKSKIECCKSTKKSVVTKSLTFDDHKNWLFHNRTIYREQMLSENNKQKLYMVNNSFE